MAQRPSSRTRVAGRTAWRGARMARSISATTAARNMPQAASSRPDRQRTTSAAMSNGSTRAPAKCVSYSQCGGHKLSAPNDIVFDRQGGFYFTDLGKRRGRDRDHGGLYYALPD